jgi:hypothetical protein
MVKTKTSKKGKVIAHCPFCNSHYLLPKYSNNSFTAIDWYTCLKCMRMVKIEDIEFKNES